MSKKPSPFLHYCRKCSKWGCFGYKTAKGGIEWYCAAHRPQGKQSKQGSLGL